MTIGAMIGPWPIGYISEKLGRKMAILSICCPLILGFFTMCFTAEIYLIYVARVLCGLAVGSSYSLLPIYLAEISQDHNRGTVSQVINIFWSMGSFACYAVGSYTSYKVFNLTLASIPTASFVLFLFAPETPYYLLSKRRVKQAENALIILRSTSKEDVQDELEHIRKQVDKKEDELSLSEILQTPALRRALIICFILVSAQEMCGYVSILFYMQPIFDAANTGISPEISSIVVSFFLFVSSLINPFFVDKAGRRFLLIVSCFGLCMSLFFLGLFFFIQSSTSLDTAPIFWLPIASLLFYIFSFNFGMSSVPSTLFSEIFPNNCKNFCNTLISSFGWGLSFVITRNFNVLNHLIGIAGTFWLFSFCCLAIAIFSIFCIPETKGKSFTAIQQYLEHYKIFQLGLGSSSEIQIIDVGEDNLGFENHPS